MPASIPTALASPHERAVAALAQAVERAPDDATAWAELGAAQLRAGRPKEGAEAMRRALLARPRSAARHNDFGVACVQCGAHDRAEAAFRAGLALDDGHVDLHMNLARLMHMQGRDADTIVHARRVLQREPGRRDAHRMLVSSLSKSGDREAVFAALDAWQAVLPDDPEPAHQRAACGAGEAPARASDRYVSELFDDFAASFDHQLAQLGYQAPRLIAEQVEALAAGLPPAAAVLDAGCGTGLCGPMLRPHAGRLVGVDLSGGMLARAGDRGYDELVQAELTAYLQAAGAAFDLVVSADTLCYFGDLHEVLRAAHAALSGAGWLVFSVEALADDAPAPVALQAHGRYAHRRNHVEGALAATGFDLGSLSRQVLRQQSGQPVPGWIVVARRRAASFPA